MNAICILLAAALSTGNAEFDKTAIEGAAKITLAKMRAEAQNTPLNDGTLKREMLSDPAKYANRGEAEAATRAVYERELRARYAKDAAAVLERLSGGQRAEDVFGEEFCAGAKDLGDEVAANAVNAQFGGVFYQERAEACAIQATGIVSATRPSEADIETKDEGLLRAEMVERIAGEQGQPVFEENLTYISEHIVGPVIEDGRRERQRQLEFLYQVRSEAYSPVRLAEDLRNALEADVAERRATAEDPSKVWNVFPGVVGGELGAIVERRTVDRLANKISDIQFQVGGEAIAAEIAANPEAHVKTADSERIFADKYGTDILNAAIDHLGAEAPEAERAEIAQYVSERRGNGLVQSALANKLQTDVMPKWRDARNSAAGLFVNKIWPTLADGTWWPGEELADETAFRVDYDQAVADWRNMKGLEDLAAAEAGKPVMEEADQIADRIVRQKFDLGRTALAGQNNAVDAAHDAVLKQITERGQEFFDENPDSAAVQELVKQISEDFWEERREGLIWPDGNLPKNAKDQYRRLFPSVDKRIELVAKAIMDEMKDPNPNTDKSPGEPRLSDYASGDVDEPMTDKSDYSISITRDGDFINVTFKAGKRTLAKNRVPAKKVPFKATMDKITGWLIRSYYKLD
ncbi:MAG: hypothetical protein ILO34_08890 [Kiritimatiellae bacterium]|nr:hypothetical protein [Kiritimatiellia bacterium]